MRRFAALFVALSCSFVLAGGEVRVAKSWSANAGPTDEVKKILVVGISTNQESRRHFENRFVSHLRGRGYDGATSHSMVEDLGNIETVVGVVGRRGLPVDSSFAAGQDRRVGDRQRDLGADRAARRSGQG